MVNADGSVGGGGSVLSRGTARAWDKPSPRMIAAAEILGASLVLDNGLVFSLAASSFIANTSDGSSERVAIHGNEPLLLARLAKCLISNRDKDDATFLPKVKEGD